MDDATLLGYLLHALDPETHRRVEAYLLSRPQAWFRVARLRRTLAPLADDAEPPRPRPALAARTVARLAAARRLPAAPPPAPAEVIGALRGFFRRADVLAASLLLAVGLLLAAPWLGGKRVQAAAASRCQELARLWAGQRVRDDARTEATRLPPDDVPVVSALPAPPQPDGQPALLFTRQGAAAGSWESAPNLTPPADLPPAGPADHVGRPVLYAGGYVRWRPGGPGPEGVFLSGYAPPADNGIERGTE